MENQDSNELLHYFKNQKHKGKLDKYDKSGYAQNRHCGDDITITLKIENGIITDLGYETDGCIISQGSMSLLADHCIGKKVNEIEKMTNKEFIDLLGVEMTPSREGCALVSFNALKKAIADNEK